jgi:uncharacterized membrane protein YcjF (UPF0283 family)
MTDAERAFLVEKLSSKYRWFNNGSRLWSAVHHWSLGLSATLSALAVIVVKVSWLQSAWPGLHDHQDDVVAVLAALATLITTLAAAGSFGRKWQANRISRGRIERLQITLSDPAADASSIRTELQSIIEKHDEGIIGTPVT